MEGICHEFSLSTIAEFAWKWRKQQEYQLVYRLRQSDVKNPHSLQEFQYDSNC